MNYGARNAKGRAHCTKMDRLYIAFEVMNDKSFMKLKDMPAIGGK